MSNEIDFNSVLGTVRRQIWFILSIVVALTFVGGVVAYGLTPKYTATAMVLIDSTPQTLLDAQTRTPTTSTDNGKIESEATILGSDSVMLGAIRSQNLVSDSEFGVKLGLRDRLAALFGMQVQQPSPDDAVGSVLRSLRRAVSIKREGLTSVIEVSVTSGNAQKAAKLANALTAAYVSQQVDAKVASIVAARNVLQTRVESANAAISQNERDFDDYLSQNVTALANGENEISALQEQLSAVERTRVSELARVNLANQNIQQGKLQAAVVELRSDALTELARQQDALSSELAANAAGGTKVADLKQKLEKVTLALNQQVPITISETRGSVAKKAQEESGRLREELRAAILNSTSSLPAEKLTEIYSLKQAGDIARKQYEALLTRLKDLDAQTDLQLADSRIVSPALVPSLPSAPNRPVIILVSLMGSLFLGLASAIVREHFIGGFVDASQVEDVMRVSLASVTPRSSSGIAGQPSIADGVVSSPLSIYSESVRRLRAYLDHEFRLGDQGGKVIMISSAVPGEGKSTLSLSLARTYAMSGKKTLLIDCDLRKPSIHKQLGVESDIGLIDYLSVPMAESASLAKLLTNDPLSPLNVLLGGHRSHVPTDALFTDARMLRLISGAKKHFDYIVMDTPPIDPVVDGLYIASHADAIAFVVKWASTSQSLSKRSLKVLQENKKSDAPIFAVLSQQDQTRLGKNYRYSGYYSD